MIVRLCNSHHFQKEQSMMQHLNIPKHILLPLLEMENLKQFEHETSVEVLDQEWDATYATILKEDMQAFPGLSTSFKNTLKKETVSEGILIKSFGFNQNVFVFF